MQPEINLSYIIATRNRLPFLKITLERLFDALQTDEEIVVVDGNSNDGSKEYLEQLYATGKINQLVSEPDRNQAHAWNKAMLMAKGIIIKKIIDDDVFCYKAIQRCKSYMIANANIEVIISNDMGCNIISHNTVGKFSRLPQFKKWSEGLVPSFTFGDVHMLIRRRCLSYIGLYNTAYIMLDWEYALHISYSKANICFYTGHNALSVSHPQSISALKDDEAVENQTQRANVFYEYAGDTAEISLWSKIKIFVGKRLYGNKTAIQQHKPQKDIRAIYDHLYNYLNEFNETNEGSFINNKYHQSN